MWPPIRRAYAWVHRAARILANAAGEPAGAVRRRLNGLLAAMAPTAPRQARSPGRSTTSAR